MAQLGGGQSDRWEFEDEFEEAFARLTAPVVEATAPVVEVSPDTAGGPGAPPPIMQNSAVCASETPAADEPPRKAPKSVPDDAAANSAEAPESAAAETGAEAAAEAE